MKRSLDILLSLIALMVLGLPLLVIAALIRLGSRGPAIFRQSRIGWRGRAFTMLKFRTMFQDAEADTGPVWAKEMDTRVTPIGRFLRRSRMDELPQFWNVLVGSMSLVGPRPERAFFTRELSGDIPAYEDRVARTKPGITGLAQISLDYDSSVGSVRKKVFHDVAYNAQDRLVVPSDP